MIRSATTRPADADRTDSVGCRAIGEPGHVPPQNVVAQLRQGDPVTADLGQSQARHTGGVTNRVT